MRRIGVLMSVATDGPGGQARLAAFRWGIRQARLYMLLQSNRRAIYLRCIQTLHARVLAISVAPPPRDAGMVTGAHLWCGYGAWGGRNDRIRTGVKTQIPP